MRERTAKYFRRQKRVYRRKDQPSGAFYCADKKTPGGGHHDRQQPLESLYLRPEKK
jgi:hypothetical protein